MAGGNRIGPEFSFHNNQHLRLNSLNKTRHGIRHIIGGVAVVYRVTKGGGYALRPGGGHAGNQQAVIWIFNLQGFD